MLAASTPHLPCVSACPATHEAGYGDPSSSVLTADCLFQGPTVRLALQDPTEVITKYGADALRLYLINSPVVRAETLRFKEDGVFAVIKEVFLPWYNAYRRGPASASSPPVCGSCRNSTASRPGNRLSAAFGPFGTVSAVVHAVETGHPVQVPCAC